MREVEVMAPLSHPNIVSLVGVVVELAEALLERIEDAALAERMREFIAYQIAASEEITPALHAQRERVDGRAEQHVGVDEEHDRCWVRRWPLEAKGSPVFEISFNQISTIGC